MKKKLYTVDDCEKLTNQQVRELYKKHVNPAIEHLLGAFHLGEELIDHAEGVWIYTRNNEKIHLILAINYGAKEEIVDACNKILSSSAKNVNCSTFQKALYTSSIPDPDVLIRTGGKQRLSNFLLWQLAYTEIFFVDKLWPDFNEKDFKKIIKKFYNIKRNFGKI